MTSTQAAVTNRYDRTLRSVMWMDAFLSVAMVVACLIATPIAATVGVPRGVVFAIGIVSISSAVLLAAFGAITAIVLMLRLRDGDYHLPVDLHVPLPGGMNPLRDPGKVRAHAFRSRPEDRPSADAPEHARCSAEVEI